MYFVHKWSHTVQSFCKAVMFSEQKPSAGPSLSPVCTQVRQGRPAVFLGATLPGGPRGVVKVL